MKSLQIVTLIFSLLLIFGKLTAQPLDQPYSSYWYPQELLSWSPEADPDAAYNRGSILLQDRLMNDDLQVNDHARPNEAEVHALSIMYPSTSGNPSQGGDVFDVYAFSYWQYIDVLVMWGGSAGEGLILSPSADVIDAAHRNGVPIYGTIFFPPTTYGGQIQWVWDLVQQDNDTYPVADKLIEIAEYYGFDGWFFNQETAGGNSTLANQIRDLMIHIQNTSNIKIMWYDSMTENGNISWQNALNSSNDMFFQYNDELVSQEMFLNFWWSSNGLTNSRNHAINLGRSPYDLGAGLDVQANGYNTNINWNNLFPEGQSHKVSLGLYCPNWCYSNSSSNNDFYQKSNRFWVGVNRDPGNTQTTSNWKGLSHYIPAKSPIIDLPFITNFNTGQGHLYAIDGEILEESDWNNRSLQDILPTWRWIVESSGTELYPELDWSDAFYGGTCLKVSGDLTSDNHIKLYKTSIDVSSDTHIDIAFKTGYIGDSYMKLGLAFENNPDSFEFWDIGSSASIEWNTKTFDISNHSGSVIASISLFFEGTAGMDYTMKVGRIGVYDESEIIPTPPTELYVENKVNEGDFITLRLKWDHSPAEVYYYNVYRRLSNNTMIYLGSTPNNAYFVQSVDWVEGETTVTIEVETVNLEFKHSDHETVTFNWFSPPNPATIPNPEDNAIDIPRNINLSWIQGMEATSHDVYFGSVNPPVFAGNQTNTMFTPGELDAFTTYYWRIDEVNDAGTTEGSTWSFTTSNTFIDSTVTYLEFDGEDDFVNCGNDPSLQITGSNITLEAWIYAPEFKDAVWQGCVITKDYGGGAGNDFGYMIRCGGDGVVNFNLGSGNWNEINSPAGTLGIDTWYHVAGTYDGSVMRLYIDGEQVASQSGSFSIGNANLNLLIGESPGFPGRCFIGKIDEVRVWNVARTQSQLQSTMSTELPPIYYAYPDSGLVGYWQFNEASGQTTIDMTENGNHAILGSSENTDPSDPLWIQDYFVEAEDEQLIVIPIQYKLMQNYPNPFNPTTKIHYELPMAKHTTIKIYNVKGQLVDALINEKVNAGYHSITWDGTNESKQIVGSGIYFYRIKAGDFVQTKRCILLK